MLLCYYATKTKKITECGNKASKDHRQMDTKCTEQYLIRSHQEVIQILCVDNCIRWGWEWPNPLLQAEILIDEDEEGDEEIDVLLWCIYYLRFSYHKNAAKSNSI